MSATFTTTINAMSTVNEDGLQEVVKFVSFTLTGTEAGQSFSLPNTVEVPQPTPDAFTPYPDLTQEQVAGWVDTQPSIQPMQAQIQFVLDKMVAEAATSPQPLPWAPPAPTPEQLEELPPSPGKL
jgi:hypothetical protein